MKLDKSTVATITASVATFAEAVAGFGTTIKSVGEDIAAAILADPECPKAKGKSKGQKECVEFAREAKRQVKEIAAKHKDLKVGTLMRAVNDALPDAFKEDRGNDGSAKPIKGKSIPLVDGKSADNFLVKLWMVESKAAVHELLAEFIDAERLALTIG